MTLEIGEAYVVTPIRFETYGAIVELEDGSTSLVHVSQISDSYVKDPSDYMSIGQQYVAKGIKGIGHKPVQLSVKHLGLPSQAREAEHSMDKLKKRYPKSDIAKFHKPSQTAEHSKDAPLSLDDMIQKANAAYSDKMKGRKKKNKRRR